MKRCHMFGGCLYFLFLLSALGYGTSSGVFSPKVQFSPVTTDVVKAMTFNIRVDTSIDVMNPWRSRKQIVVNMLAAHGADVVGLQESLDDQTDYIQQYLPEYEHYAVGRNDGMQKGEACPIFYRKGRFDLMDSGTFWFSKKPTKPGSKGWGSFYPRICSWVRLKDKQAQTSFYVYNVHMDHLSQNSRKHSVRLLARKIAERRGQDPFIVMGDFNMKLDNSAMRYLQKEGFDSPYPKMVDAWESVNAHKPDIGTRHGFSGRTSGPKIDHIPVSEGIETLKVVIDRRHAKNGRYPSDHFPVIALLRLNPFRLIGDASDVIRTETGDIEGS